jgi:hypothetical protein
LAFQNPSSDFVLDPPDPLILIDALGLASLNLVVLALPALVQQEVEHHQDDGQEFAEVLE